MRIALFPALLRISSKDRKHDVKPLSNQQRRYHVNSEQLYENYRAALRAYRA